MEAKVIKRFRDKNTKKVYEIDTLYEGTEKRVKEITDKGFLEAKTTTKKATTKKEGE